VSGSNLLPLFAAALLGAAACSGGGAQPASRRHVVEIRAFEYHPESLTVAAGDTVVWVNRDAVPHTATSEEGLWDSGSIAAGNSWTRIASEAGSDAYLCTFHPTMTGRIQAQ
jgi:plastocyanin